MSHLRQLMEGNPVYWYMNKDIIFSRDSVNTDFERILNITGLRMWKKQDQNPNIC